MLEFTLSGNIDDVLAMFRTKLSDEAMVVAVYRTLNDAQRLLKAGLETETKKSHNINPSTLKTAYSYKPVALGATESVATIRSKGLSLRGFVVGGGTNGQALQVQIKALKEFKRGFVVTNGKGKDLGVFARDGSKGKVAPTKGSYAGRVVTRGPNKGQKLTREMIDKKYTVSVPKAADANVLAVFEGLSIEQILHKHLQSEVDKLQ